MAARRAADVALAGVCTLPSPCAAAFAPGEAPRCAECPSVVASSLCVASPATFPAAEAWSVVALASPAALVAEFASPEAWAVALSTSVFALLVTSFVVLATLERPSPAAAAEGARTRIAARASTKRMPLVIDPTSPRGVIANLDDGGK